MSVCGTVLNYIFDFLNRALLSFLLSVMNELYLFQIPSTFGGESFFIILCGPVRTVNHSILYTNLLRVVGILPKLTYHLGIFLLEQVGEDCFFLYCNGAMILCLGLPVAIFPITGRKTICG